MVEKPYGIREVPLLPLRGMVVFPSTIVPLEVGREKSVRALEEAMNRDHKIFLATQKQVKIDEPSPDDIFDTGTVAEIKQIARLPGGTIRVVVEGICRGRTVRFVRLEPHFSVEVQELHDDERRTSEIEALMRTLVHQYEQYVKVSKKIPAEALATVVGIKHPGRLADTIATQLPIKVEEKQDILNLVYIKDRLEKVFSLLNRETEVLELEKKINVRVRKQIERTQKEYYLREQMKAIQKELGDRDDRGATEAEEFREKVKEARLPEEVEERVLREIDRFEKMPSMSAEAVVSRTYIEWILAIPWQHETTDCLDLNVAQRILDEDHYGLDKVKERIIEYLAVRQLVSSMKGPILCFVGPPGVGKTSLARSIARALGRKFVRISLGGVRDEAEIRGHRRTYVGALPGRIIQGMKQAGSKNPVFLMDEIDKLTSDFRGDPASALLEVLDPEQNSAFSDHYIEMPFDLSRVMFITTANTTYSIPRPLLDRMETIYIPGYTEDEKVKIAQKFLVPKQVKEHGLSASDVIISENAIYSVIRRYTREAGVRNLEREIAAICRKIATEVVKKHSGRVRVTVQSLNRYLGRPKYRYGVTQANNEVGVAVGVAVTESGGDVMPIEVNLMKGKGQLILTGKLGDVMKESAQAGYSYIRANARKLGVDEDFNEKYDIHIHIPEGAIPKDGPSAGITMTTAMVSALSGTPVYHDVAMTGEITLRGKVLSVGGIKEKVLAAHRAGVKRMILPRENLKEADDIPQNVRREIEIRFVEHIDEVLEYALERPVRRSKGRPKKNTVPLGAMTIPSTSIEYPVTDNHPGS
ncbi:MAG: endopeptidase La [Bacillota bacterium]